VSFFYTVYSGCMKRVLCVRLCTMSANITSDADEHGEQKRLIFNIWEVTVGDVTVWQVKQSVVLRFFANFIQGLFEIVLLAVRHISWFSTMKLRHTRCRHQAVSERGMSSQGTWMVRWWPTAWSRKSRDRTPIHFCPVGTTKETHLRSP
jgi:hypothetical protein